MNINANPADDNTPSMPISGSNIPTNNLATNAIRISNSNDLASTPFPYPIPIIWHQTPSHQPSLKQHPPTMEK